MKGDRSPMYPIGTFDEDMASFLPQSTISVLEQHTQ